MYEVTDEERQNFLNRQGWKQASSDDRKTIENTWTDAIIRMAIDLNLA